MEPNSYRELQNLRIARKKTSGHIVQFYENDEELASAVVSFVEPVLLRNEGMIIIATQKHCYTFERELSNLGLNVSSAKKSQQLIILDAEETLSKIMVNHVPDADHFNLIVGDLIEEIGTHHPIVNVYGEMVSLLWDSGNVEATLLLEQLWNDLAQVKSFKLLCGYCSSQFHEAYHKTYFNHICNAHSRVVISGKVSAEELSVEHSQAIAKLQQREKALENEIAKREKIEIELRKNQSELHDFFENSVVGLHWVGPDGTILRANKAELDLLGYTKAEYVGRNIVEFHADEQVIRYLLDQLKRGQTVKDFPVRLKCKDGSIKHVLIDSSVYWVNGQFRHTRCFTRDITAKMENEQRLILEKHKLDILISDSSSSIGLMRGPDLVFEIVNKKWTEMVSPREYIGRKYVDVYPELVGSIAHKSIQDIFETGIPFVAHEMKLKIINPEGIYEEQYFDYTNIRIMDGEGKPYGVYCNAANVTDRVLTRKRLEKSKAETELEAKRADRERAKFEAAFQAVAEGIFIFDSNGDSVFMNDTAAKVFGLSSTKEVTQRIEYYFKRLELRDLEDRLIPFSEGPMARVLRGELFRDWQLKVQCLNTGNQWVWNFSGELTKQAGSDIILGVVVLRDITQQKRAEDELKMAKQEAEKANQLKSAFLANMSHEIRTPLGAMVGFADLLKDPSLSREEHDNYIDILIRSGDQLSTIINDILDLSKVEAGHLKLEYVETDPYTIAEDIVSLLSVKAKEKNLILDFNPDLSTPKSFVTDPGRVKQILMNIVGNAIKFTQVGSIKIRSYGVFDEKKGSYLYFEVTDTGIGIPKGEQESIFKAFVQADGTLARKFGGTGLGLALSRQLARHLGGEISIPESIEGKGSVFLVCIQDKPQLLTLGEARYVEEELTELPLADGILKGVRVLVVDDSPDNRQLFGHFLNQYGASVEFAENGVIGLRKALGNDFDIVLMDIQMPEMDGYTATQRLREVGYHKPIVALTAHAMTEVRKKCLSVGCTDHLTKPIKASSLINTVAKYSLH